jgi:hypothetical protein
VDNPIEPLTNQRFRRLTVFLPGAEKFPAKRPREWLVDGWEVIDRESVTDSRPMIAVRFSSDGERVARIDRSGVVEVSDSTDGEVSVTLAGDAGSVKASSHAEHPWFSPDNERILTAHDGTVRLWDVDSGTQIGAPFPNDLDVTAGGRSGDVLQLVTAVDEHLLIWNLDTSTWFDVACEAAGRNMTQTEWDESGPRDSEYRATCPQYPLES